MQERTLAETPKAARTNTSAILIANPTSGSYTQYAHDIENTVTFLQSHGWQAELKLTQSAGDASRIAQEAVEQRIDVVVAIGGDGTINEVIQELAGSETALAVLPAGTVNVWAREIGIPLDNAGARQVLLDGQIRKIDLGKINDRYFLLMVGIGVDGEVTHAIETNQGKRFGVLGYLAVATWLGFNYRDFRIALQLEDTIINTNALQIIVGNTQLYGGALKYTWKARCDDGLLDICIIRKRNILGRMVVLSDFLLRRPQRIQWVRYETGKRITLLTREPVAIQVDGDSYGYTAVEQPVTTIEIAASTLKVLVPQKLPADLFSATPPQ